MPIAELGKHVHGRQWSSVELTELFLNRLERIGPRYKAIVTITRERALKQAHRADRELATGHYRGPLHGIPYGAKDLLATSGGIPTTWGAAPFRNQTFDYDATVIKKLEKAGAVLVAKLAMIELAGGMGYRQPNACFTGRLAILGTLIHGREAPQADQPSPYALVSSLSPSVLRHGAPSCARPTTVG